MPWIRIYWGMIAFSLAGTLASAILKLDPGPIKPLASAITLLVGVMICAKSIASRRAAALIGVGIIGAAAEICGLLTGYPFGKYEYTREWAPVVSLPSGHFFPLLLPLAWLMVVVASYLLFAKSMTRWLAALGAAFVATLVDIPMEFVIAKHLHYWRWTDPSWPIGELAWGVPLLNSVGWFVTAFVACLWVGRCEFEEENGARDGLHVLGGHLVLMIGIAVILSLTNPAPIK